MRRHLSIGSLSVRDAVAPVRPVRCRGSPQQKPMQAAGAVLRRFQRVCVVVVVGLAGALVGVVSDGVSAVAAKTRCRATAFVTNQVSGTVSTIDVKTRKKDPADIPVGPVPFGV